jgi:2-iminobutanoate/2-iminopropanoate deaminase
MRTINASSVPAPRGSYSHAVLIDPGKQWLFISGQVAFDGGGNVPDGIDEQSQIVWSNIVAILEEAGMGIDNIVKLWTCLTDDSYVADHARVRSTFLGAHRPASTLVIVPKLVDKRLMVEVECIAAK